MPFDGYSPYEIRDRVVSGTRPKVPSTMTGCPNDIRILMQQCWHLDASTRPDFETIYETLEDVRRCVKEAPSSALSQVAFEEDSLAMLIATKKK